MDHYFRIPPGSSSGFTLLEVLIAAVVLSVSMLGLIVLQGVSKFSSYEARQRTTAMYVAMDLQDRLRLNKLAWVNQKLAGNGTTYATTVSGRSLTLPACAQATGLMTGCSQGDLVNLDLYSFQELLAGAGVSGTGNSMISPVGCLSLSRITSQNAANVTITISWQDRESLNGNFQNSANTTCGTAGGAHRQYVVRTVL
jgi:type IV pilus assembly protein PilV